MMKNIKLDSPKTVSFRVKNFYVPSKKTTTAKHTIYAARNCGFNATERDLKSGYVVKRLEVAVYAGLNETMLRPLLQIDATAIKKIFCFNTRQNNDNVNIVIAITENGIYYVPLFASVTPRKIEGSISSFDCFAYSFSKDTDYIFAANDDGIFVADKALLFKAMDVNLRAAQMQVFNNRLFILDKDAETIHFSAALDLCDFSAETGLAGSIKVDGTLGKILSLESYGEKLLLVHEYGFRTLETSFDPVKFNLKTLAHCYESITPGSAKALGDTIYFLTRAGLCRYQQKSVELLDPQFSGADAQSIVYDNKYFLAVGGKMLVIEKFFDSITVYENMNIRAFERVWTSYSDSLAVLLSDDLTLINQVAKTAGTEPYVNTEMVWESDWFALGYATTKQYVRRVLIKTTAEVDLIVINTRGSQKIKVKGAADIQTINLNMKGDAFKVKLVATDRGTDISSLSVVVGF